MNIFWETIAQYNAGTWIYQLIITLVGLWLTYSLFHHPTPAKKKGMKLYLIFINAWVAVVYYHIYCDPRSYSNALALFWGIMCVFWIYDLIVDYTPFELNHKHKKLAVLLCFLPLAYPLFSVARGMDFPMMTSPVMPCSDCYWLFHNESIFSSSYSCAIGRLSVLPKLISSRFPKISCWQVQPYPDYTFSLKNT